MTQPLDPEPKPEGNWRFRRIYIYASAIVGWAILTAIVWKLTSSRELMWVALALIALAALRDLIYLIAPTAQAIVSGLAAWRGGRR